MNDELNKDKFTLLNSDDGIFQECIESDDEDPFEIAKEILYEWPEHPEEDSSRLKFMIDVKQCLDSRIIEKGNERQLEMKNELLAQCINTETLKNLLDLYQDAPHFSIVYPEKFEDELDNAIVESLQHRGITVNDEVRYRIVNFETILKSVLANILLCDATLHTSSGWSFNTDMFQKTLKHILISLSMCDYITLHQMFPVPLRQNSIKPLSLLPKNRDDLDNDVHLHIENGSLAGESSVILSFHTTGFLVLDNKNDIIRIDVRTKFTLKDLLESRWDGSEVIDFPSTMTYIVESKQSNTQESANVTSRPMNRDLARLAVKPGERYPKCTQLLSWGRNKSGSLGIGSMQEQVFSQPGSVPLWGPLELVRISKIACASTHSAIMSDMGFVYTWGSGFGGALGHGDATDCDLPRLVASLNNRENPLLMIDIACGSDSVFTTTAMVSREGKVFVCGSGGTLGLGDLGSRAVPTSVDELGEVKIEYVACGAGFCVAQSSDGDLYSWGVWERGRLGLGPIELRTGKGPPAAHRFKLTPKKILIDEPIKAVCCGESHCLAITTHGVLYAWGNGLQGQLGTGFLLNELTPVKVTHYLESHGARNLSILLPIRSIACGSQHSMIVDEEGRLLTFGGLGGACLGAGPSFSVNGTLVPSTNVADMSVESIKPHRPSVVGQPWRFPRIVPGFQDRHMKLGAGGSYSAVVLESGRLYLCGDGPVCGLKRFPSFTSRLGQYHVDMLGDGASHLVLSVSGSSVAEDFRRIFARYNEEEGSFEEDDSNLPRPDLVIETGGESLYAHRAIVSTRCSALRTLIELEEQSGFEVDGMTKLSLSELDFDVSMALLEYLYGDNLYAFIDPVSMLPVHIRQIAAEYGLKRLEAIAARAQFESSVDESTNQDERDDEVDLIVNDANLASTFDADMLKLINERRWSDIIFTTTDDKELRAHSIVLISRSSFFSTKLSKLHFDHAHPVHLEMPYTFSVMLRILYYIYGGKMVSESEDELIEDVAAASRYQLHHWRRSTEEKIVLTIENCIRMVQVAYDIQSASLLDRAMQFVVANLSELESSKTFRNYLYSRANFATTLMQYIADYDGMQKGDRDCWVIDGNSIDDEPEKSLAAILQSDDEKAKKKSAPNTFEYELHWNYILGIVLAIAVYLFLIRHSSMLQFVPFINLLGTAGIVAFAVYFMSQ